MATASVLTTDEDIDAAIERAQHLPDLPGAVSARYDASVDAIILELQGGRRLLLPRSELQGLEDATEPELSEIEIHGGSHNAWPKLDVDHYLPHLMAGQYGSSKWMGRLERMGLPDTPLNSPSAVARLRTSEASYSLFQPSSHVENQALQSVTEIEDAFGTFAALDLQFESKTLRIAALGYNDTVEITLVEQPSVGKPATSSMWQSLIGQKLGYVWIAINQQGYLDTVLLGFSSVVAPDVSVTAVASGLSVRRLVG
jgi:hypothetical protein